MKKLLNSAIAAFVLLVIIIIAIIYSFKVRTEWWMFIDIFCAFMGAFMHLMALVLSKMVPTVRRAFDNLACVFGILFVISFVVEYILIHSLF